MESNVFSISQNHNLGRNGDQLDDDFDAFNDDTFGEMDSTDWESEHNKLTSISVPNVTHDVNADITQNSFAKNTSLYESRVEEDFSYGYEDIVAKSISNLGLEDEDFGEDPAIMTFARSSQPIADQIRRNSRSSSPPTVSLSYEEYSASPQSQSIWSATKMDTTLTPTISSSVKMQTLEEIEDNMVNKNNNDLFELSTIKRPIRVEDLETNLMREFPNSHMTGDGMSDLEKGWSSFAHNSMQGFTPNGRIGTQMIPNVESIEHKLLANESPNRNHNTLDMNAIQSAARMAINASKESNESFDPLFKAKTLADIERQLISDSPPKTRTAPNVQKPELTTPVMRPSMPSNMTPTMTPIMTPTMTPTMAPNMPTGVLHSTPNMSPHMTPNRHMNPHMSPYMSPHMNPHMNPQMRPHMMAQNRMNNMYNRPPVMHMMPGMHPAMGRGMFPPTLIPNSQRMYPFPLQARPIMHPLLHPMQIKQQRHPFHQNNSYRPQNRYYESQTNDDDYSGLMTQREKEWLIKIQQMQTELKDPYVDDYYYVTYISRKIAAKAASDKDKTTPSLLLPERPKPVIESEATKYVPLQFEGTLGKIQASNVNCPRKLLDCNINKTNDTFSDSNKVVVTKSEVQKFRKLLLHIEKLYVILINIDDEDKRIGALPPDAQIPHLETRKQLSDKLFKGLTNETNDKISTDVIQIKKGLLLVFRSVSYLSDDKQRAVIISDLKNANNFKQYILKPKSGIDFEKLFNTYVAQHCTDTEP